VLYDSLNRWQFDVLARNARVYAWFGIIPFVYLIYLAINKTIKKPDDYVSWETRLVERITVVEGKVGLVNKIREVWKNRYTFSVDKPEAKQRYKITDWLIAATLTAIAAIMAFTNLGDRVAPQTFWTPERGGYAIIEFYDNVTVTEIQIYRGGTHYERYHDSILISFSEDGERWSSAHGFTTTWVCSFTWLRDHERTLWHSNTGRYVRIESDAPSLRLGQVGFRDATGELIPIRSITSATENAEYLIDAQELIPQRRSFMNSAYFDEIYHPRTAYEILNGLPLYEVTHPHLGKIIMSFFISIFGMTPFGWRFAGALFGVLMIPILYFFARDMFKSTFWATFAASLFLFDFMRFAQTRLATIDTYVVFFGMAAFYCMYKYYKMSFYETPFNKTLIPLALSGLFMGLGIANKWQGVYVGIGLAIVFAIIMYKRFKEHLTYQRLAPYTQFNKLAFKTCLWCVLFFVVAPTIIYMLAFIPHYLNGDIVFNVNSEGNFISALISWQRDMYRYHGVTIAAITPECDGWHPFASSWWQWVLNLRPIFYYAGSTGDGLRQGISAFGNPIVWWGGLVALLGCIIKFVIKHDKTLLFLFIAYFTLLLPWVPIQRMAFIYHYFPNVPFLILLTVYVFKAISESQWFGRHTMVITKTSAVVYACIAVALFILFYPVLSGRPVEYDFVVRHLRWFSSWRLI